MATDLKISQLTVETAIQDADVVPIVDVANSITKKTTWANIKSVLLTYFVALFVDFTTVQTLTNKILGTGTKITVGSDATGDIYYRDSSGLVTRRGIGSSTNVLTVSGGLPVWAAAPTASNGSTTTAGIFEEATQAEVDAKTTVGGTGADLTVNPSTLRSTKYSDGVADTGSANAYVITPSPAITAYAAYQEFNVKITNTNTSSTCTLNVSGLGTKTIVNTDGTAIFQGQLKAGGIYNFLYDGTNMQVRTSSAATNIVPQKIGGFSGYLAAYMSADSSGLSTTNKIYISYTKAAASPIITASRLIGNTFVTDKIVTPATTAGQAVSVCVVGNYVYANGGLSGSEVLTRYDKDTLLNATAMTVSGTGFISSYQSFSDGTKLYAVTSANTVQPYSISGTTATSLSTITFTGMTTTDGVWYDGTTVYQISTSGNINTWPITGGSATGLTQYLVGGNPVLALIKQTGNTSLSFAFASETSGVFCQPVPYQ